MSFDLDTYRAEVAAQHAAQVAAGLHDHRCEWRPTGYYLCHCSKRKREAEGYTEPPGELIHQYPLCPRCGDEVDCDGDSFTCEPCRCTWSMGSGETARFFDDYGDLDPTPYEPGGKWHPDTIAAEVPS